MKKIPKKRAKRPRQKSTVEPKSSHVYPHVLFPKKVKPESVRLPYKD